MANKTIIAVGVVVVLLGLAGWGLVMTQSKSSEVNAQLQSLLSTTEKRPIDTDILNKQIFKDIENYKSFGTHPIPVPNPSNLNRTNPFQGV